MVDKSLDDFLVVLPADWWQVIKIKPGDLAIFILVGVSSSTFLNSGLVKKGKMTRTSGVVNGLEYVDKRCAYYLKTNLFFNFSHYRILRVLAVVNKAGGEHPGS